MILQIRHHDMIIMMIELHDNKKKKFIKAKSILKTGKKTLASPK